MCACMGGVLRHAHCAQGRGGVCGVYGGQVLRAAVELLVLPLAPWLPHAMAACCLDWSVRQVVGAPSAGPLAPLPPPPAPKASPPPPMRLHPQCSQPTSPMGTNPAPGACPAQLHPNGHMRPDRSPRRHPAVATQFVTCCVRAVEGGGAAGGGVGGGGGTLLAGA